MPDDPEEPSRRSRPRASRGVSGAGRGGRSGGTPSSGARGGRSTSAARGSSASDRSTASGSARSRKDSSPAADAASGAPGKGRGAKGAGTGGPSKGAAPKSPAPKAASSAKSATKTTSSSQRASGSGSAGSPTAGKASAKRAAAKDAPAAKGAAKVRRGLRPALTSRAAILALVVCTIALSLAYPLREYIAQRAEIAQLRDELAQSEQDVEHLTERREELNDPAYIEREARTRLHYAYPGERSYVVITGDEGEYGDSAAEEPADPWFTRLWKSVRAADDPAAGREQAPDAEAPPGG